MVNPPSLPFSNTSTGLFPNPTPDDFLMSQVAIMIASGFVLNDTSGKPEGHYVLMGTTPTNFHAESLLCTLFGMEVGWNEEDCPSTAEGWPKPENGRNDAGTPPTSSPAHFSSPVSFFSSSLKIPADGVFLAHHHRHRHAGLDVDIVEDAEEEWKDEIGRAEEEELAIIVAHTQAALHTGMHRDEESEMVRYPHPHPRLTLRRVSMEDSIRDEQ